MIYFETLMLTRETSKVH